MFFQFHPGFPKRSRSARCHEIMRMCEGLIADIALTVQLGGMGLRPDEKVDGG
jgi:hypothetical protein